MMSLLKDNTTESILSEEDLDFETFLWEIMDETVFDPAIHALFLIPSKQVVESEFAQEDVSQPILILNERSWLKQIRIEANRAANFYYQFTKADGGKYGDHIKPLMETMGGESNITGRSPRSDDPVLPLVLAPTPPPHGPITSGHRELVLNIPNLTMIQIKINH